MNGQSGVICGENLNIWDDLSDNSHRCRRVAQVVLEGVCHHFKVARLAKLELKVDLY